MKQRPLKLGNALSFSDTALFVLLPLFSSQQQSKYHPCMLVDPCWEHKFNINTRVANRQSSTGYNYI